MCGHTYAGSPVSFQVVGAPCWLRTLPPVLLGVRNRQIFPSNSPKMLKMVSEIFIRALLLF